MAYVTALATQKQEKNVYGTKHRTKIHIEKSIAIQKLPIFEQIEYFLTHKTAFQTNFQKLGVLKNHSFDVSFREIDAIECNVTDFIVFHTKKKSAKYPREGEGDSTVANRVCSHYVRCGFNFQENLKIRSTRFIIEYRL